MSSIDDLLCCCSETPLEIIQYIEKLRGCIKSDNELPSYVLFRGVILDVRFCINVMKVPKMIESICDAHKLNITDFMVTWQISEDIHGEHLVGVNDFNGKNLRYFGAYTKGQVIQDSGILSTNVVTSVGTQSLTNFN